MFRRLSEPLPLSEASLLLLRPALNAPVLNVGYLPVGPARAAVVAFAEEYGGIGIALGVRALESGQLAVVRNQESIDFDVPLTEALEPLLAEAERMGFLFDEDIFTVLPGSKGRSQAMAHWAELMGGMEGLLPTQSEPIDEPGHLDEEGPIGPLSPSRAVEETQYPELLLDDVAPLVLEGDDLSFDSVGDDTLDADLDDELEDSLEDVLDESLEQGADDEWELDDSLLGDADWTEPTAPIGAARQKAVPSTGRPSGPSSLGVPSRSEDRPGPAMPASAVASPAAARPKPPPAVSVHPGSGTPALPADAPFAAGLAPAASAQGPAQSRAVLSKFRTVEGSRATGGPKSAKSEVGADGSSELARIPIVRVRREREPGKRLPFLARLLSSF